MKVRYAWEKVRYGSDDPEVQLGAGWQKKVFESTLNQVLASVHERGISTGLQARSYGRILAALDGADTDHIELDRADVEFLKSVLWNERATVNQNFTRTLVMIQDEVELALKNGE